MSATIPAYIGHNTYLHWPQYLFTSANTVTCVGHNTTHLRRPKHLFTSAKTLVYVGQCCDLHQLQYLSFTSAKTLVYVGHNTCLHWPVLWPMHGHNTSHLRPQKYWPAPATTQVTTLACVKKNSCLRRPQHRPESVKILACVGHNTGLCKQK